MAEQTVKSPTLSLHGASVLPSVEVDSYNLELRDDEGFIGDRASRSAFRQILDKWREPLRDLGDDPLGDKPTEEIAKKKLDTLLLDGSPEAAGIIHSAIEEFAGELVSVIRRFLRTSGWRDTEGIVFGGGFRASRVGELAIGRAAVMLKADGIDIDVHLISHDPDEAGLIGAAHLMPAWILKGFDGLLAVDIGGTNVRAGLVETNMKKDSALAEAFVRESELWRHANEELSRDELVAHLIEMLQALIRKAEKSKLTLAPVIGIGCPGLINADGTIETGAQNLPGNWHSSRFKLAEAIVESIPEIAGHDTAVVIHNDAVVQGLSELPAMREYDRWGALTIGTGLGNVRFTTRRKEPTKNAEKGKVAEKQRDKSKRKAKARA